MEGRGSIQGNQAQQGGPSGREREDSLQALEQRKQVSVPWQPRRSRHGPTRPKSKSPVGGTMAVALVPERTHDQTVLLTVFAPAGDPESLE